jgi:hypothetical protein
MILVNMNIPRVAFHYQMQKENKAMQPIFNHNFHQAHKIIHRVEL